MTKPRFNENLLKVPLYIGGKSIEEVKEEHGLERVVKMASNESPMGPSPQAVQAAQAMLAGVHRYPGVGDRDLRRKLAAYHGRGLTEHNFVIGNGGTDVLRMIVQAFIFDGGNAVMSAVTFPMYHIHVTTFGGENRRIPTLPDYAHDLDAMLEAIDEDTRLVFLCTPNNPTGHLITQEQADAFMARVPEHVVVVFDEAYYDYVTDPNRVDALAYVLEGRNVLCLRSFSKSSGLAGLRIGYLIGPQELADYVRHARLPFHSSDVALAAAAAALDDTEYREQQVRMVIEGREYLQREFTALGLKSLPSQANFVLIYDPPIRPLQLAQALERRGYIVRAMGGFGLPNGLRVSVGTPEENRGFIQALRAVLQEGA